MLCHSPGEFSDSIPLTFSPFPIAQVFPAGVFVISHAFPDSLPANFTTHASFSLLDPLSRWDQSLRKERDLQETEENRSFRLSRPGSLPNQMKTFQKLNFQ